MVQTLPGWPREVEANVRFQLGATSITDEKAFVVVIVYGYHIEKNAQFF